MTPPSEDYRDLMFLLKNPNQVKQSLGLVMMQAATAIEALLARVGELQQQVLTLSVAQPVTAWHPGMLPPQPAVQAQPIQSCQSTVSVHNPSLVQPEQPE